MLENVIRAAGGCTDLVQLALLLVVLHHRHAGLREGVEAFAHGLRVVVTPPTGLATLCQPLLHGTLRAVKEQYLQT